ncbi:MAG: hypothetical protein AAF610_00565 [Pseudomonadota bacterium]
MKHRRFHLCHRRTDADLWTPAISALIATTIALAGCGTTLPNRTIDTVQFAGDVEPRVATSSAFQGQFDNLAQNESLIVARASDGGGALSSPEPAWLIVTEPQLEERTRDYQYWLSRCDFDGDGMLDRDCPELFLALQQQGDLALEQGNGSLVSQKIVSIKSWYTINQDPDVDRDNWGVRQVLNTTDAVDARMPVTLKLLAVNTGNKAFDGDLDVLINIPARVSLGNLREASKVKSRAKAKGWLATGIGTGLAAAAMMSGVPVAPGIFDAGAALSDTVFDDFERIDSEARFTVEDQSDTRIAISVENIQIGENEGITIEYDALYEVIDE